MNLTQEIPFTKLHGARNSFVFMQDFSGGLRKQKKALAQQVCCFREGIGADGLILLQLPTTKAADFKVTILNRDGSEALNCGNALRCAAKWVRDLGYATLTKQLANEQAKEKKTVYFETRAGIYELEILKEEVEGAWVKMNMGAPSFEAHHLGQLEFDYEGRHFYSVSMGNPHAVTFVTAFDFDYAGLAGRLQSESSLFPEGANLEFVRVMEGELEVRVVERGVGETYACATGASAAAVIAIREQPRAITLPLKVKLLGGTLEVSLAAEGEGEKQVFLKGPAERVCSGTYFFQSSK